MAEFGVALFLFVVGLEMRPSRLWGLRNQIFGLINAGAEFHLRETFESALKLGGRSSGES